MNRQLLARNLLMGSLTLLAVIFLKWSAFDLLLVYWLEMSLSSTIGFLRTFRQKPGKIKTSLDACLKLLGILLLSGFYAVYLGPLVLFTLLFIFILNPQHAPQNLEFWAMVSYILRRPDMWITSIGLLANWEKDRKPSAKGLEPYVAGFERLLFLLILLVFSVMLNAYAPWAGIFTVAVVIALKACLDSVSSDRILILKDIAKQIKT